MAMMATIGITDDLEKVSIALLEDGKQLAWIEFTDEQCVQFIKNVEKYRGLLKRA